MKSFLFCSILLALSLGPLFAEIEPHRSAELSGWRPQAWSEATTQWWTSPHWPEHLRRTLEHLSRRSRVDLSATHPQVDLDALQRTLGSLEAISRLSPEQRPQRLKEAFILLAPLSQVEKPGFFTGYYSPSYRGRLEAKAPFVHPVYSAPEDPHRYTREDIVAKGMLKGRGFELCYLASPLEAYLLQVQGSGTVELANNKSLRLAFSSHNGRPYLSLGKVMIEAGLATPETISLDLIRERFDENPQKIKELMLTNPRYIFFHKGGGFPRGSTGAVVEAHHSIATERFGDGSYRFPPHWPFLLVRSSQGKVRHVPALAQDTGSAIVGELRADIYMGQGEKAETLAGDLKERSTAYAIWPRELPLPTRFGGHPIAP